MQELRFVAVSEDGSYAVLAVPGRSARFTLAIDERLRAVALGQTSRLAQYEIEVESPLRPKEIQARIRAGETAEEIADAAGIPVERVRWFEGPVLAERAYIAEQAQAASVRRQGDSGPGPRLGDIVPDRLSAAGSDPEDGQWDSRKRGDGNWQVQLTFSSGGRLHIAEWVFDPRRRHVMPDDDNAARLSLPESDLPPLPATLPGEATVTPLAPRLGAVSAGALGGGGGSAGGRFRAERPAMQERAVQERVAQERVAQERAVQERPVPHERGVAAERPAVADRPVAPERPVAAERSAVGERSVAAERQAAQERPVHRERTAVAEHATLPHTPAAPQHTGAPRSASHGAAPRSAAAQPPAAPASFIDSERAAPAPQRPPVSPAEPEVPQFTSAQPEPYPVTSSPSSAPAPAAPAAQAPEPAPPTVEPAAPITDEQVTQPPRPGKKNARNRRASVPSWDEIMLGSSRQRE